MPTEGPERQEVINKGQSAYRRTRASRSYQQKARAPTEGSVRQGVINKDLSAKLERTTKNDRHDGNHTRIGCSYMTVVPMNISSHREVGDLAEERKKGERDLLSERYEDARSRPQDNIRQDDYDT